VNRAGPSGFACFILLFGIIFFIYSCAPKMVRLLPLDRKENHFVRERFLDFLDTTYQMAVDADVNIDWDLAGRKISLPGIFRAQNPTLFYLRTTDALGRPLYLLASDGYFFTFADNREGEGYIGPLDSDYWQQYIPSAVRPEDLYKWLCGRLKDDNFEVVDVGSDPEGNYWFVLDYGDGLYHHVQFDQQMKLISRHQLATKKKKIIFDVSYSEYSKGINNSIWPGRVEFRSSAITGSISIKYEKIYSHEIMPEKSFELDLPDHYKIYRVN